MQKKKKMKFQLSMNTYLGLKPLLNNENYVTMMPKGSSAYEWVRFYSLFLSPTLHLPIPNMMENSQTIHPIGMCNVYHFLMSVKTLRNAHFSYYNPQHFQIHLHIQISLYLSKFKSLMFMEYEYHLSVMSAMYVRNGPY